MKKILTLIALISLVLTGCSSEKDENVLVVGTNSGYAPYEEVDTDGNLFGFDIDLAEMIADDLGYKLEWKDVDFNALVIGVKEGKFDFAIAGMTPTADRKLSVDFSNNYYSEEDAVADVIISLKNKPVKFADLDNKKIGTQQGTKQEVKIKEYAKEATNLEVISRASYSEIIQEIKAGRMDVLIAEYAVAEQIVSSNPDLVFNDFDFVNKTDENGNAIAFKKGSPLVAEFNKSLAKLEENGELEKLINKYFK